MWGYDEISQRFMVFELNFTKYLGDVGLYRKVITIIYSYNDVAIWTHHGTYISQHMFSLRKTPILDDDAVIMCPVDMIGCDNRGTKGVRLGQLVLREPVSYYYLVQDFCWWGYITNKWWW